MDIQGFLRNNPTRYPYRETCCQQLEDHCSFWFYATEDDHLKSFGDKDGSKRKNESNLQGMSKQTCKQETIKIILRGGRHWEKQNPKFQTLKGIKIK